MPETRTSIWLAACAVGLLTLAILSAEVHRRNRHADAARDSAWLVGPRSARLNEAAEQQMKDALAALNSTEQPGAERISRYREHLRLAQEQLLYSLRANPAQAGVLAELAAVRWELEPIFDEDRLRQHANLISIASRMAPEDPRVQIKLGGLLLAMARRDDAATYLARAVELSPTRAPEIVLLLDQHLFTPDAMLEILGTSSEALAAVAGRFLAEGRALDYLEVVERQGPIDSFRLLGAYARACAEADQPQRLLDQLADQGPAGDPALQAEWCFQGSRAAILAGQPTEALRLAGLAVELLPGRPRYSEQLGVAHQAAGEFGSALHVYRDALGQLARQSGTPGRRARVYRRIGELEEERGRPDLAYDAFKKALALNAHEPHARRRVTEMESIGGSR